MVSVTITLGKGDFVKRWGGIDSEGNRTYLDVCLCLHNLDLSRGCISNVNPTTGERNARKYGCGYPCYARRSNYHEPTPDSIDKRLLRKEFIEKKPKYLRLGKRTDCGHKSFRKGLIKILELCYKYDAQAIMPTKHLEYDKRVARLMKNTGSVLQYSLGLDDLEHGASLWGHDNKFRFEEAQKYFDAGINTIFNLVTDVTVAPKNADEHCRGNAVKALDISSKFGIPVQLVPIRLKSKKAAYMITGESWSQLQSTQPGLFGMNGTGRYVMQDKFTELIPAKIDPSYSNFVKKKMICGKVGDKKTGLVYCGKCGIKDSQGNLLEPEAFPQKELPYVEMNWKYLPKGPRKDRKQMNLTF